MTNEWQRQSEAEAGFGYDVEPIGDIDYPYSEGNVKVCRCGTIFPSEPGEFCPNCKARLRACEPIEPAEQDYHEDTQDRD